MNKWILIALVFLSNLSFAADREGAFNKICNNIMVDSSRNTCVKIIRNFIYFDDSALNVCAGLRSDFNKSQCLLSIGDKDFATYELRHCGGLYTEANRMDCLNANGTERNRATDCVKKHELIGLLTVSLDQLYIGKVDEVEVTLLNLRRNLETCQE